jgi:CXXX repeat peptide maturase
VPEKERRLIALDDLKAGVLFAMKENLNVQFVYPDYELPTAYTEIIDSIDHTDIVPKRLGVETDVIVMKGWDDDVPEDSMCILHTTRQQLADNLQRVETLLNKISRLNIVLTDVETFKDEDIDSYKKTLGSLSDSIVKLYQNGKNVQLNLLTDRMMLNKMNNCGAGNTSVTLAPNGKFYVCPAFYYDNEADSIGDLKSGLDIKNKQLYQLDYAPICSHCDAWQCKRCIWLNQKTTLEVNTPSHQQCVLAHIERNASRELLNNIRDYGTFLPEQEDICEINYLDPFDNKDKWL